VWPVQSLLIEVAFRRVEDVVQRHWVSLHCRSAAVPEESRRVHSEVLGQQRDHVLPDVSGARPGM
jgi:hypothetical protein